MTELVCKHCGSGSFVKNGMAHGQQRYRFRNGPLGVKPFTEVASKWADQALHEPSHAARAQPCCAPSPEQTPLFRRHVSTALAHGSAIQLLS